VVAISSRNFTKQLGDKGPATVFFWHTWVAAADDQQLEIPTRGPTVPTPHEQRSKSLVYRLEMTGLKKDMLLLQGYIIYN
jgi:hypothetical protein